MSERLRCLYGRNGGLDASQTPDASNRRTDPELGRLQVPKKVSLHAWFLLLLIDEIACTLSARVSSTQFRLLLAHSSSVPKVRNTQTLHERAIQEQKCARPPFPRDADIAIEHELGLGACNMFECPPAHEVCARKVSQRGNGLSWAEPGAESDTRTNDRTEIHQCAQKGVRGTLGLPYGLWGREGKRGRTSGGQPDWPMRRAASPKQQRSHRSGAFLRTQGQSQRGSRGA